MFAVILCISLSVYLFVLCVCTEQVIFCKLIKILCLNFIDVTLQLILLEFDSFSQFCGFARVGLFVSFGWVLL